MFTRDHSHLSSASSGMLARRALVAMGRRLRLISELSVGFSAALRADATGKLRLSAFAHVPN